ncbi:MAG: MoaD/ThiS family protein [Desulfosalsimonadaceae bacterium]
MKVRVKLFAVLRDGRFRDREMEFPDGSSLGNAMDSIGIPREEVSLPLINGRYSSMDDQLHDGDVLSVFPSVGGG